MKTHHRIPPTPCPHCAKVLDSASQLPETGPRPKPGDVSVCLTCAGAVQYGPELQLQPVNLAQLDERTRGELDRMQRTVRSFLADTRGER